MWYMSTGLCAAWLHLTVDSEGWAGLSFMLNVTGASPVYVEAAVEELNIRVNEMLFNLGRVPHAEH